MTDEEYNKMMQESIDAKHFEEHFVLKKSWSGGAIIIGTLIGVSIFSLICLFIYFFRCYYSDVTLDLNP